MPFFNSLDLLTWDLCEWISSVLQVKGEMKASNIPFPSIKYRPKASTAFKPRPRNDISESETKLHWAHDLKIHKSKHSVFHIKHIFWDSDA